MRHFEIGVTTRHYFRCYVHLVEIHPVYDRLFVLPLARKWDTPRTNHKSPSLKKNKKKSESRVQPIDRRTRPISGGGSNQREPPVLRGSPSHCAFANTLFLLTSRAPEEQRQSRRNHSGGKSGGNRGIGGIGQNISPRSTLRCV